ncbi:MAG: hypothetical protein G5Z43_000538 [Caldisphaeraceae archaeon]|nr:hypothetical protein [Caldisphaeraceae archaeon]
MKSCFPKGPIVSTYNCSNAKEKVQPSYLYRMEKATTWALLDAL